ncbi:uncharacterized protein CDAR_292021 [Caerostris darwini]|uniref:Gustatory receptor n=1 Tax=Caerostris darwini TaxID=1538125 RepID=A0AAV4Q2I5_9ARAC|nr:uncharacterized protein CDAR_292021 [Caerostris darwini]
MTAINVISNSIGPLFEVGIEVNQQSSPSHSDMHHSHHILPKFLLRYLGWVGFVEESDKNFKTRLIWFTFYLVMVFMSLDNVALHYLIDISIEIVSTHLNLLTLLYCSLCLYCSSSINSLADKVARYSPEEFVPFLQLDILRRKVKIDALLHDIQNMFSKPSLLLMMANYISCIYCLGLLLIFYDIHIQLLLVCAIHFICIVSVLWSAGTVPVALNKLQEVFQAKTHSRLLSVRTSDELQMILIKKEFIDKTNFALSGWDIVLYKKSTILAFVGTLLTYSLLTTDFMFKTA